MKNISSVRNCYGCGVCATACRQNIIEIELNSNGFYEPFIADQSKCTNCGICLDVCAFLHKDLAEKETEIHCYSAWSNDLSLRRKCSSGGIGFEIGSQLIEQGYKAVGVRYNVDKQRAEHFIAETVDGFLPSIGSKYIQSYTVDCLRAINRRQKHLVIGTPCQIDSFRRYIQKFRCEENFILLDFFCHSVPSMLLWKKYIKLAEKKVGVLSSVSWRNKLTGWHDSWSLVLEGKKNSFNSRLSQGDFFYKYFLGDYCCNKACRLDCKYKYDQSSADIRIGDFWGQTYKDDDDGVSTLISFTSKGQKVISHLYGCTLMDHPFSVVAEGQMKKNAGKAYLSFLVFPLLKTNINNKHLWKLILFTEKALRFPGRVFRKLKKVTMR